MSEVITTSPEIPERIPETTPVPASNGAQQYPGARFKITVHRLDGGLEEGDSDERGLSAQGYPIYNPSDADRPRWIPARDIKYVVFGVVDDPNLEADPGDKSLSRKAILRFRDGEWIAAYIDPGQAPDSEGVAIKIRLAERQRVIPALAASSSILEMQFVDMWAAPAVTQQPQRRRRDTESAAELSGAEVMVIIRRTRVVELA